MARLSIVVKHIVAKIIKTRKYEFFRVTLKLNIQTRYCGLKLAVVAIVTFTVMLSSHQGNIRQCNAGFQTNSLECLNIQSIEI